MARATAVDAVKLIYLRTVYSCPARGAYMMQERDKVHTETELYETAMVESIPDVLTSTSMQETKRIWERSIKAVFPTLEVRAEIIANGICALDALRKALPNVNLIRSGCIQSIENTQIEMQLVCRSDRTDVMVITGVPASIQSQRMLWSDPAKLVARLLHMPWMCVDVYRGTVTRPTRTASSSGDMKQFNSIIAMYEQARHGVYHPVPGQHCGYCQWREQCKKEFR